MINASDGHSVLQLTDDTYIICHIEDYEKLKELYLTGKHFIDIESIYGHIFTVRHEHVMYIGQNTRSALLAHHADNVGEDEKETLP